MRVCDRPRSWSLFFFLFLLVIIVVMVVVVAAVVVGPFLSKRIGKRASQCCTLDVGCGAHFKHIFAVFFRKRTKQQTVTISVMFFFVGILQESEWKKGMAQKSYDDFVDYYLT